MFFEECFMRRFAISFVVLCFAVTFLNNSMFMLSIEKGNVYTENYNLNHLLTATYSSSANNPSKIQPVCGSGQFLSHRHVQLARYTIPEKLNASAGAATFSSIDSFPANPALFTSLPENFFPPKFGLFKQLKFPIAPLLQSSVLLI